MDAEPYSALAAVYDWLLPDALLEPEGAVGAFSEIIDGLPPSARILDCAAGTGQLAVGLALRGFEVIATDASAAMLARADELAVRRGVALRTEVCRWDDLDALALDPVDAVFCVGNSLTHAAGQPGRRTALAAMGRSLRPEGLLVVTSRNWDRVRAQGSGLQVGDQLVSRQGRLGLVIFGWQIPEAWEAPHVLHAAVALFADDDSVTAHSERLTFWPFSHEHLQEDLRASGLTPSSSTYVPEVERYLVTARRSVRGA